MNFRHGYRYTKLYQIWDKMKQRCLNPKATHYENYGGRGITICDEWLKFIPFRDWSLSNGYQEGLEIDRIKNNLGYNPENCRFVTTKENNRNKGNVKLTMALANEIRELYKTDKYTQKELAEKYNMSQQMVCFIVNNKNWM